MRSSIVEEVFIKLYTLCRVKVAENVYRLTVSLPFAVVREVHLYYIHDEKPAIIESGPGYGLTQQAITSLERLGFNIKNVVYLIPTHEHPDHIGGNVEMKQANGNIKIGAHPTAVRNYPYMHFSPPSEALAYFPQTVKDIFKKYENQQNEITKLGVDFTFEEGDVVELGETKLKVLYMPGHAQGHVCFYDEKRKLFFAGDNITGEGTPYVGGLSVLLDEPDHDGMKGGNLNVYLETLDRIEAMDIDMIFPAHGPLCEGKGRVREIRDRKLSQTEDVYTMLKQKGKMLLPDITASLYNASGVAIRLLLGSTAGYVKKLLDDNRIEVVVENGERYYKTIE